MSRFEKEAEAGKSQFGKCEAAGCTKTGYTVDGDPIHLCRWHRMAARNHAMWPAITSALRDPTTTHLISQMSVLLRGYVGKAPVTYDDLSGKIRYLPGAVGSAMEEWQQTRIMGTWQAQRAAYAAAFRDLVGTLGIPAEDIGVNHLQLKASVRWHLDRHVARMAGLRFDEGKPQVSRLAGEMEAVLDD